MGWCKKTNEEIKKTVFDALAKNMNYAETSVLGIPASYLDKNVFSQDERFLKDAPFLSSLVRNPNHIGCHTLENSESFFKGTQAIEREVIQICSEEILKAESNSCDGYVASGGTEANIQAIWIYRNYFIQTFDAKHSEIAILCSTDSHYSMDKAANLLNINIYKANSVNSEHAVTKESVFEAVQGAKKNGIKYFIVVSNMMTTMFGSVDDTKNYTDILLNEKLPFKLHLDGAYGGFYYPFANELSNLNFSNEHVSSVTLDAHKMAQAPYGTGIFLIRKGLMHFATTKEASYVEGEDSTLIGSRSGANAISIWMILSTYGPFGWAEKIFILQKRTTWMCERLNELQIEHYRNPFSNIITIKASSIEEEIATQFGLVPDNHHAPNWFKIVVMDHVVIEDLQDLLNHLVKQPV